MLFEMNMRTKEALRKKIINHRPSRKLVTRQRSFNQLYDDNGALVLFV